MKTVDPSGHITEWTPKHEWTAPSGWKYIMSRPKDQDQDEPATPPSTQTRSLGWTGYHLTVRELRGWLDKIPDQAILTSSTMGAGDMGGGQLIASWEVP